MQKPFTAHIISLFPESMTGYVGSSILKRAQESGRLRVSLLSPRDYATDKHKTTDDRSYGGGPGMVMKAEPIIRAVQKAVGKRAARTKVLIMSPRGVQFTNAMAKRIATTCDEVVFIAGRYEGVDARVRKVLRAREVSIGPYVLTGGELPALVMLDAIARHIPGVLGKKESLEESRVASGEVYTRPEVFQVAGKSYRVPKILVSGDHKQIDAWRARRDLGKNG